MRTSPDCSKYYKNKEYKKDYYHTNKEKFIKPIYMARRHYYICDEESKKYPDDKLVLVAKTKKAIQKLKEEMPQNYEEILQSMMNI
jgi:hypothetical protein